MSLSFPFSCCWYGEREPEGFELSALNDSENETAFFSSPESFAMARVATNEHEFSPNGILQPSTLDAKHIAATNYGLFLGDTTQPPRSLLEASSRRVAKHIEESMKVKQEEKKISGQNICKRFTEAYTKALKNANLKWASEQNVTELFHQEAKLITHDKQIHVGLTAIIRRLNTGVENLLKMADQNEDQMNAEAAEDMVSVSEPKEMSEGVWVVTYKTQWGIRVFTFEDEFHIHDNKIKKLKRSRA
eukprot:g5287.t1